MLKTNLIHCSVLSNLINLLNELYSSHHANKSDMLMNRSLNLKQVLLFWKFMEGKSKLKELLFILSSSREKIDISLQLILPREDLIFQQLTGSYR